jgi:protein-S-isoprenylcysteine O-methyltransferase Ste14
MALREEFENQGNWLFIRRSWFPFVFFPLFFAALLSYGSVLIRFGNDWHCAFQIFSIVVSLSGLLVRAIAIGYAPAGTSGRNTTEGQIAEKLNITGIYSLVRHPLYLGNFLIFLGFTLFTQSLWFNLFAILGYWIYYERIMFAEEEFLRRKYGLAYEEWATGVPAFIPKLKGWVKPDLSFSFRNVLKREYTAFLEISFAFPVLDFFGRWYLTGFPELDYSWLVMLGIGLLTYIILRTLKKTTRILDVEGR